MSLTLTEFIGNFISYYFLQKFTLPALLVSVDAAIYYM